MNFTKLRTKKQVRSFLGITGYFIHNYASVASSLTDLTRKTQLNKVTWTPECATAFKQLKQALCSSPLLMGPEFDRPFTLQTDASDRVN